MYSIGVISYHEAIIWTLSDYPYSDTDVKKRAVYIVRKTKRGAGPKHVCDGKYVTHI
jgi:hypothetical protein